MPCQSVSAFITLSTSTTLPLSSTPVAEPLSTPQASVVTGLSPTPPLEHTPPESLETSEPDTPSSSGATTSEGRVTSHSTVTKREDGLYKILPYLHIPLETAKSMNALMDECSSSSFIIRSQLEHCKILATERRARIISTVGHKTPRKMDFVTIEITTKPTRGPLKKYQFGCYVVESIASIWHSFEENLLKIIPAKFREQMNLVSPHANDLHLIIGIPEIMEIRHNQYRLTKNLILYCTPFGYAASGVIKPHELENLNSQTQKFLKRKSKFSTSRESESQETVNVTGTEKLANVLGHYWEAENLPLDDNDQLTLAEVAATRIVKASLEYDPVAKRYTIKYPFIKPPSFVNNKRYVYRKYQELERRLMKADEERVRIPYTEYIDKFIQEGKAEELTKEDLDKTEGNIVPSYFMTHFFVLSDSSESTPTRPVYDMSGKCPRLTLPDGRVIPAESFNQKLLTTPSLIAPIIQIHLRFRRHAVAVCSDIKRMFHQLSLHPDERLTNCFFWRMGGPTSGNEIKAYKNCCLNFGSASAPFMCSLAFLENAQRVLRENPNDPLLEEAQQILSSCSYVDDVNFSVINYKHAKALIDKMMFICDQAHFHLRKFASSSKELLELLPEDYRAKGAVEMSPDDSKAWFMSNDQKPLGLKWDPREDKFYFSTGANPDLTITAEVTRRQMTSIISLISFDSLGFRAPYVFGGRLLAQQSFKPPHTNDKGSWDQPLSSELTEEFNQWKKFIPDLGECYIPRYTPIDETDNYSKAQVFVTSDGGEFGSCATAHLRFFDLNKKQWDTIFLAARCKVRKKTETSIPRIELAGALLAASLIKAIQDAWHITSDRFLHFVDSEIIYHWCRTIDPLKLSTYISARVIKIKQQEVNMRLLPSADNCSDLGTKKGCQPKDLMEDLWAKGPPFWRTCNLEKETCDCAQTCTDPWPAIPNKPIKELDPDLQDIFASELTKAEAVTVFHITVEKSSTAEYVLEKYGTHTKQVTILAAYLRVQTRLGKRAKIPRFLEKEDNWWTHRYRARLLLVQASQLHFYSEEFTDLLHSGTVKPTSSILKHNPFIDDRFIPVIRSKSRIQNIVTDGFFNIEGYSNPLIVHDKSVYIKKLCIEIHETFAHASFNAIMMKVTLTYLVPRLRERAKTTIKKCTKCQKEYANRTNQLMASLPAERLDVRDPLVLSHCMTDLIGPILVKDSDRRNSKASKKWVVLLCCMVSRYIIAEIVDDLSCAEFIRALSNINNRHFCLIKNLFSDNATNFVAADKEVRNFLESKQHEIEHSMAKVGFKWSFGIPGSPHGQGCIERFCGEFKRSLRASYGQQIFSSRGLETTLLQCCAYLNSRPLTYQGSDDPDLPVCPGNLMFGAFASANEFDFTPIQATADHVRRKFQHRQQVYKHFKAHFLRNYLNTLRERSKWVQKKKPLKIGQLVLIEDSRYMKQSRYPLGKIVSIPDSRDKLRRVYGVQIQNNDSLYPHEKGQAKKILFPKKGPKIVTKHVSQVIPLELDLESETPEVDRHDGKNPVMMTQERVSSLQQVYPENLAMYTMVVQDIAEASLPH